VDGEWVVSEETAHYATITPEPNTFNGNTIIYAHNREHLFKHTLDIKLGDPLYVQTIQGYTFVYKYVSDEVVEPTDVSVFYIDDGPQVTLLTCHGPHDSLRRLLFFELVRVDEEVKG
jgi:LPXTG-site transpeptidase (sortase) family protein